MAFNISFSFADLQAGNVDADRSGLYSSNYYSYLIGVK